MLALFAGFDDRSADIIQGRDSEICKMFCLFLHSKVIRFEITVIETVVEEVKQIRHNGFRTFRL